MFASFANLGMLTKLELNFTFQKFISLKIVMHILFAIKGVFSKDSIGSYALKIRLLGCQKDS